MTSPSRFHEAIREQYINYMLTAFAVRSESLQCDWEAALREPGVLDKGPILEALPEYVSSGVRASGLPTSCVPTWAPPQARRLLGELLGIGLFPGDRELYGHQLEMLETGIMRHAVITAGTGAGKTEALLAPILSSLVSEAVGPTSAGGWGPPNAPAPHQDDWWSRAGWEDEWLPVNAGCYPYSRRQEGIEEFLINGVKQYGYKCMCTRQSPRTYDKKGTAQRELTKHIRDGLPPAGQLRVPQRDDTRHPAIRALIVYPTNALVEDQLSRLRAALDSDDARAWCKANLRGNLLHFGRYTSLTPVSGRESGPNAQSRSRELRDRLASMEELYAAADAHDRQIDAAFEEQARPLFQRPDGAEMRSRWDMQETPPDILITNFSMLGTMLLREEEEPMFDLTRHWLEAAEEHVFHVVLDEMHMYRGAAGAEVAGLLRVLLDRLGLNPRSPQVRFLGASASLDDSPATSAFFQSLLGVDAASPPVLVAGSVAARVLPPQPKLGDQTTDLEGVLAWTAMTSEALLAPVSSGERGSLEGADLVNLASKVFMNGTAGERLAAIEEALESSEALTGKPAASAPRFRAHSFFRNVPGLWGEPLTASELRQRYSEDEYRQTGDIRISAGPSVAEATGRTLLEMLYCEMCGAVFFAGKGRPMRLRRGDSLVEAMILTSRGGDEESPGREVSIAVQGALHRDLTVFLPDPRCQYPLPEYGNPNDLKNFDHDTLAGGGQGAGRVTVRGAWLPYVLDVQTSILWPGSSANGAPELDGWLFQADAPEAGAMPRVCLACGQGPGDAAVPSFGSRSWIRGFRSGFGKVAQLLAQEARDALASPGEPLPKVVAFADSRQEAADLANKVERFSRKGSLRDATLEWAEEVRAQAPATLANLQAAIASLGASSAGITAGLQHQAAAVLAAADTGWVDLSLFVSDVAGVAREYMRKVLPLGIPPWGYDPQVLWRDFGEMTFWTSLLKGPDAFRSPMTAEELRFAVDLSSEGRSLLALLLLYSSRGQDYLELEGAALGQVGLASPFMIGSDQAASRLGVSIEEIEVLTRSVIRVLARSQRIRPLPQALQRRRDRLRTSGGWPAPGNIAGWTKRYMKKWAEMNGDLPLAEVLNEIHALLTPAHDNMYLRIENLAVRLAQPEAPIWRCERCLLPHLERAQVCTRCLHPLDNRETAGWNAASVQKANYYALRRIVKRFHCEELTGATERDDQPDRARRFRGIVLGEPNVRALDEIDLLSVTTTLEVGVDIGSLRCIFLSNMPPTRFNYQQRAGRAGRRRDRFSFVVTYCRGRFHDEYYYDNLGRMLREKPPVPILHSRPETRLRLLHQEALRLAFADYWREQGRAPEPSRDSRGRFGVADDWDDSRSRAIDRLLKARTKELLRIGIEALDLTNLEIRNALAMLTKRITDVKTQGVVANVTSLSARLAEAGVLPTYGLPTRQRQLYHPSYEKGRRRLGSIDRPLDAAISDFAPGSSRTKDKTALQPVGFTALIEPGNDRPPAGGAPFDGQHWLLHCEACLWSKHEKTDVSSGQLKDPRTGNFICPNCGISGVRDGDQELFAFWHVAVPHAFRTEASADDAGDEDEGGSGRTRLFGYVSGDQLQGLPIGRSKVQESSGLSLRVNSNGGRLFLGTLHPTYRGIPEGTWEEQWITDQDAGTERLALAAPTATDMLLLWGSEIPAGLTLDPLRRDVRAAHLSAGYLLRTVATIALDADPEDIEVAELRRWSAGTAASGLLQLVDAGPGGSGIVREFSDRWKDLLRDITSGVFPFVADLFDVGTHPCATSCYDCLRGYHNQPYHDVLDWRDAITLLRVWGDQAFDLTDGAALASGSGDLTLDGWADRASASLERLRTFIGGSSPRRSSSSVPYMLWTAPDGMERPIVVHHPLWDVNRPRGALLEAWLELGAEVTYLSSFDLARWPDRCAADVYQQVTAEPAEEDLES